MHGQKINVEHAGDEISLQELINMLWKQKWLILIVTLMCILASVTYLAIVKPVYEAKAYIVPPASSDIRGLNIGRTNENKFSLQPLTVNEVYRSFINHFVSESVKRDFFNTIYFPSLSEKQKEQPKDRLYAHFLKSLIIKDESRPHAPKYLIAANSSVNSVAHEWVSQYIAMANKKGISEIEASVSSENKSLANYDLLLITKEKEIARKKREDKLVQLKEALVIAKATGIKSLSVNRQLDQISFQSSMYLRGSVALEEEVNNLENRKSDDPFVPNIRNLEAEYNFYNNLEVPIESVKIFRLDGDITLPDTPVSPKTSLILMLGLFGGFLLGCMMAMMRGFFKAG